MNHKDASPGPEWEDAYREGREAYPGPEDNPYSAVKGRIMQRCAWSAGYNDKRKEEQHDNA